MDVDFVLEKNGQFLVMEFKPEGVGIPLGQRLTLRALVQLGMDVWVVWENHNGTHVQVGPMDKRGEVNFVERMTVNKLRNRVVEWRERVGEE